MKKHSTRYLLAVPITAFDPLLERRVAADTPQNLQLLRTYCFTFSSNSNSTLLMDLRNQSNCFKFALTMETLNCTISLNHVIATSIQITRHTTLLKWILSDVEREKQILLSFGQWSKISSLIFLFEVRQQDNAILHDLSPIHKISFLVARKQHLR